VIFLAWIRVTVCAAHGQGQPAAEGSKSGQDRILLVLPFDNRTGQPNLEWVREAAPEILGARFDSAGFEPMSRPDQVRWITWGCRNSFNHRGQAR
jgi:hypothetical protein